MSQGDLDPKKQWLIERILTQARFEEVLDYLDLAELRRWLPQLRIPETIKHRWDYALKRWSHAVET